MATKWLLAALSFIAVALCLSCITITQSPATPTPAASPATPTYVILTNIANPKDPYYQAIAELQQLRNGRVVRFEGTVKSALSELKAIRPRYMAVAVKPEMIEELFAYDIFTLAREIASSTGVDLAYGLLTGATAGDVLGYIQRIETWEREGKAKKATFRAYFSTGEGAFGGGLGTWGDKLTQGELQVFTGLGMDSKRIDVSKVDDTTIIADLQKAQCLYLHFFVHGSPTNLDDIRIDKIIGLGYPSVVFNSGCYGGCIGKWYNQSSPGMMENYKSKAVPIDSSKSLALRFLKSGCMAYFGHMRMTGDNSWVAEMTNSLATAPRATAGDLALAWYKKAGLSKQSKGESCPKDLDLAGFDCNLFNYSAVILVGDPAIRILP